LLACAPTHSPSFTPPLPSFPFIQSTFVPTCYSASGQLVGYIKIRFWRGGKIPSGRCLLGVGDPHLEAWSRWWSFDLGLAPRLQGGNLVSPVLVACTFSVYYCKYCKYSVLLFPLMYILSYIKFVMFVYILGSVLVSLYCPVWAQWGWCRPLEMRIEIVFIEFSSIRFSGSFLLLLICGM
jgi:hypothetical protein